MKFIIVFILTFLPLFGAVDINNASFEELVSLKGIGKKKAKRIIKYRKKHCFKSIKEITKVKCICESVLRKNKGNIIAGDCQNEDEEDDE